MPNRVLFNDRLTQAIALAERQGKQLAVMFVDLDHFKKINDSLGHDVGDKLLQSVAGRLIACVRHLSLSPRALTPDECAGEIEFPRLPKSRLV